MPPQSLRYKSLKHGESAFRRRGNVMILRYQDKKEAHFLSTIHQMESARTRKKHKQGEDIIKPVQVNHYNRFLGGIDRHDAMIGNYSSVRKSMKWTTKVAFHLIEEAVLNSFILFNKVNGKKRFLQLKLLLICHMLGDVTMEQNFQSLPNLVDTFLSLYHQLTRKKKHRKDVLSVQKKRRGKKEDVNVKPVQSIQDFVQLLPLKFFTQLLSKLAYIK